MPQIVLTTHQPQDGGELAETAAVLPAFVLVLALSSQVFGQGLLVYALGEVPPLVVGLALLTQPAISALNGWLAYGERRRTAR